MRVRTIVAGAAATAAALLAAPPAQPAQAAQPEWPAHVGRAADPEPGRFEIDPGSAKPDETVTVRGRCERPGDETMRITSHALRAEEIELDADGGFNRAATVRRTQPGRYTVTVVCLPSRVSYTEVFYVHRWSDHYEAVAYPKGAPQTGGGGALSGGRDRPPLALLLLPVALAGAAGAAVFARSRGRA
ncbi:hypothetical protein [Thermomonospora cellulosilytica]|uniref:Uncharacterized protein n=1 Tax=Thermomonospora cellulosilytica TaxID=1411118 RepID=A0A7W3R9L0_9ACTN|nr:hypothetical protein [Thermomonospora cellulosilytica]MBA9005488.1 hypothetical protein [Thermomonospora cellulosilytica]